MKLEEKRDIIRAARNAGDSQADAIKGEISGLGIAKAGNEECDRLIAKYGLKPVAPVASAPAPAAAGALELAIAAAVAPHVGGKVDQAQFDALLAKSSELENRLNELAKAGPSTTIEIKASSGKVSSIGIQHFQFETLLRVVGARINAYLPGPAGSGKTTAAEKVAEALGLEFSSLSVCGQTTLSVLLGYMDATGNYVSTEFRKRYEEGGVFVLDEIDAGNPNVISVLNSALANGHCAFPDGMVSRHADFVLIATANTVGSGANAQYVGRNPLDGATIDRFAFIDWQYDSELELALIDPTYKPSQSKQKWTEGKFSPVAWGKWVQALRAAAASLRSLHIISPRATINGVKLLAAGFPQDRVEEILVWKGISTDERLKIESQAIRNTA